MEENKKYAFETKEELHAHIDKLKDYVNTKVADGKTCGIILMFFDEDMDMAHTTQIGAGLNLVSMLASQLDAPNSHLRELFAIADAITKIKRDKEDK